MEPASRYLVFHGTIVLMIGLLCGAPYGRAINRGTAGHIANAWRVAHLSLPIGAILMFAVAPLLGSFAVAVAVKQLIADALIVSGYAFSVALPLGAMAGERGLSFRGPLVAKTVFAGNILGAVTSLVAAFALISAAFMSL